MSISLSEGGTRRSRATDLPTRLAAQIMETARRDHLPAGTHLREAHLADQFRVSRTPINMALQLLEQMGIVESRKNRGFFLLVPAEQIEAMPSVLLEGDDDPIYYKIAEDRLEGRLAETVWESELMRLYSVSRARLTRLLAQMAREGWVERLPGNGWQFQPTLSSAAAYEQGYRYRLLIEPAALLEPGYAVDPKAFDRVRKEQEWMLEHGIANYSHTETFQIRANFHETIVGCSGNIFYLEGLKRVNRLRRLFEYRIRKEPDAMAQECHDHLEILDILELGDTQRASRLLAEHLGAARAIKMGLLAEHPPEPAGSITEPVSDQTPQGGSKVA